MAKKNAYNRSDTLIGLIIGIILALIGLLVSPVILIAGIVLIVQNRRAFGGKTEKSAAYKSAPKKPSAAAVRPSQPRPVKPAPRQTGGVSYQSYAQDHYHITNAGLSAEKRLEQLEVMKDAGLIDKEEYHQRRQMILGNK